METKGIILGHHLENGGDYDIFIHAEYPILVDELAEDLLLHKLECQVAIDFQKRNTKYIYIGSIEYDNEGFKEIIEHLKTNGFVFKYNGY